ncbi:UNVERIFIED_CONTAM: hypothetical protein FKN15_022444 [Acipenser sinensis]
MRVRVSTLLCGTFLGLDCGGWSAGGQAAGGGVSLWGRGFHTVPGLRFPIDLRS